LGLMMMVILALLLCFRTKTKQPTEGEKNMSQKKTTNHRPAPTARPPKRPTLFSAALIEGALDHMLANPEQRREKYQDAAERLAAANLLAHFKPSPDLEIIISHCEADVQLLSIGLLDVQQVFDESATEVGLLFWFADEVMALEAEA
jgi:hypothetical protein